MKFALAAVLILSAIFYGLPGFAFAPSEQNLDRCEHIARVYNRCENRMVFYRGQNRMHFPSLNKSVICDDERTLSHRERLRNADIASTLSQRYPVGRINLPITQVDFSPGGIRSEDLNKAVYGASKDEVKSLVTEVNFLGQKIKFNRRNGAANQLQKVSDELVQLYRAGGDQQLVEFLAPFLGDAQCLPTSSDRCVLRNYSFVWRFVKGTTSLSNHSFATAIDLLPARGTQYWLWDIQDQVRRGRAVFAPGSGATPQNYNAHDVINFEPRANRNYPSKLVDVFEKHGFIWGGKWYRYDVMHFEYRPEFFSNLDVKCNLY